MCGITGVLRPGGLRRDDIDAIGRMTGALVHRGPDEAGLWQDEEAGIALGHRRLSILELSPLGSQPMASASGRFVVAFNGEIYNWRALRSALAAGGSAFRGHSDTEVMLAAFEQWGVEGALRRFVGMFAFAVWDRADRRLMLARDRLGEKPLFYAHAGRAVLFGSELKSIRAHPAFASRIDRRALVRFFAEGYVPAPMCIWEDARKLEPGCLAEFDEGGGAPTIRRYWDPVAIATVERSDAEALAALDAVLREAVTLQMVADVPVGAFLSGGIDSSTVVALMKQLATGPVRTFTIGFTERAYDESGHAQAVAEHLGTVHTALVVTPEDARAVLPLLPEIYDEPLADQSQIPTYLVSRLAREHVTVSLSGDGGDELFAGYSRYAAAHARWEQLRRYPARHVAGAALGGIARMLPAGTTRRRILAKGGRLLAARDLRTFYARFVQRWDDVVVPGAYGANAVAPAPASIAPTCKGLRAMTDYDLTAYLPDDVLVKVDRAAMAVSLETRAPFLDHRVVELALSLPDRQRHRNGTAKWLLREYAHSLVPCAILERPKMGFGVPMGEWIRGPLRQWAAALLDPAYVARAGLLDPAAVSACWREHLDGTFDNQYLLWDLLSFQAWHASVLSGRNR